MFLIHVFSQDGLFIFRFIGRIMGHNSSTHDTPHSVNIIHGKLQHHVGVLRRIATMTYAEFLESVAELNKV